MGFWLLMAAVSAVCFSAGLAFLAVGAWPVFGFFGLDVALLYVAFRLNYRSGRLVETIRLGRKELIIIKYFPNDRIREWRFAPFWVRVTLNNPLRHDSRLVLSSHGRHVDVGSFLTPEERNKVAGSLRTALAQWRESPDF
jgi:uncharacterized membrane protein